MDSPSALADGESIGVKNSGAAWISSDYFESSVEQSVKIGSKAKQTISARTTIAISASELTEDEEGYHIGKEEKSGFFSFNILF